jgi:hypothetical protein
MPSRKPEKSARSPLLAGDERKEMQMEVGDFKAGPRVDERPGERRPDGQRTVARPEVVVDGGQPLRERIPRSLVERVLAGSRVLATDLHVVDEVFADAWQIMHSGMPCCLSSSAGPTPDIWSN